MTLPLRYRLRSRGRSRPSFVRSDPAVQQYDLPVRVPGDIRLVRNHYDRLPGGVAEPLKRGGGKARSQRPPGECL
jgi:hypothetical protein